MDLKRILVATNHLSDRDAAFERGLALARSSGAEVYLLHAVPPKQPFAFRAAERLQRIADMRQRAQGAGVAMQTVEQHGDPAQIIELHAQARDVDLIVMGGQTQSPWWGGRSRIAESVIRRARVPTLVVPSRTVGSPAFRSVLVALDLSPASEDVLTRGIALIGDAARQLTVVHTLTELEAADAVQSPGRWKVPEYRAYLLEDARRKLQGMLPSLPEGVETNLQVRTGSAPRAIRQLAGEVAADLVIVGRSRGFKLLGSTALRVLRSNDRALLVIPSAAPAQVERKRAA